MTRWATIFLVVAARLFAFLLVLVATALMPAPVRAGHALQGPEAEPRGPSLSPA